MTTLVTKCVLLLPWLAVILPCRAAASSEPSQYVLTDLGPVGGGYRYLDPTLYLNNLGQVTGDDGSHIWLWKNGTRTQLDDHSATYSTPTGINDAGFVIGRSGSGDGHSHSFITDGINFTDLSSHFESADSNVGGLNSLGMIATSTGVVDANRQFTFSGASFNLVSTPIVPNAVSDRGQIVGSISNHAYIYTGSTLAGLTIPGEERSGLNAISSNGIAAGWYGSKDGYHAFIYDTNTSVRTDLPVTPSGVSAPIAKGINGAGQTVGDNSYIPFIYQGGKISNLPPLVRNHFSGSLYEADAINSSGQIVGRLTNGQFGDRAYLLTPVGNASTYHPTPEVTTTIAPNTPPVAGKTVPRLAKWDESSQSWLPITEGSVTSNNIHVLVHGWGKGEEDWVQNRIIAHKSVNAWDDASWYQDWTNLAKSIVEKGDPTATVLGYSWLDFSATDNQLLSAGISRAATDGSGQLMARFLERALPSGFAGHLDLYGHSHGSRVAAIAATRLETDHVHVEQLTVADSPESFLTNGVPVIYPANAKNNLADVLKGMNLGRTSGTTFVDNYISAVGTTLRDPKNDKLKNIVDVNLYGPAGDITVDHGYPNRWFANVTNAQFPNVGLAWSPSLGTQYQSLGSAYRQDWFYIDNNGNAAYDKSREGNLIQTSAKTLATQSSGSALAAPDSSPVTQRPLVLQALLTQGTVVQTPSSVTFVESGTALWNGRMTTLAGDDTLTFDYSFTNPGDGDQLGISIDDQMRFFMTGVLVGTAAESSTINIGDLLPGDHIVSIGLYAYGDTQASVNVSNLAITSIPEPITLEIVGFGVVYLLTRRGVRSNHSI